MTHHFVPDAPAMLTFGESLAARLRFGWLVELAGLPGAGKTTLAQGLLRGLGYHGAVTSPTYTLVETYPLGARTVYHIDLYRIESPADLAMLGLRELLQPDALCLVEWLQNGATRLPAADVTIHIAEYTPGRQVTITSTAPTFA